MSTIRRSCVTPKLVSKGWSSCIRSSRISIRFMNTRRPRNKDVFACFAAALEVGNEVIVCDVLQKLFSNALLDIARQFQTLVLQRLNVCGYDHTTNLDIDGRARAIDPPFGNHAIAVHAALPYSGGL